MSPKMIVLIRKVHDDINFGFFQQSFLAPRMTLNYNPEEEKTKYQVLLFRQTSFLEFLKKIQVPEFWT